MPLSMAALAMVLLGPPVSGTLPNVPPYGGPVHTIREATYGDTLVSWFILRGELGYYDRLLPLRATYAQMNANIPAGSKVLAAVDDPALLDFSRFDFSTLDEVGTASPPPGIPIMKGKAAVVAYLKRLGYDGIVASDTSSDGYYYSPQWQTDLSSDVEAYRAMGVLFVGWARVLSSLEVDRSVTRTQIGTLEYLAWSSPRRPR
ncbi:MAG TPA: hypothetical protein VG368_06215 [Acidimicrobiales bacterium]|nr:hypothetical protein [Acidimicrobiales bacterium]